MAKGDSAVISRRRFLGGAAARGGALIGIGLLGTPAQAQSKLPQKSVNYQATPHGSSRCATCASFEPPSSCKLVESPIVSSGWCTLYRAKS